MSQEAAIQYTPSTNTVSIYAGGIDTLKYIIGI